MPSRPFYGELCSFMASEPVVVQVLEGEGAIAKNREVMGATDPANADAGTIRKEFALSKGENSVHGSDSRPSRPRAKSRSSSRGWNWWAEDPARGDHPQQDLATPSRRSPGEDRPGLLQICAVALLRGP